MGAWIVMGILIAVSIIFPPLALIIIPFILVSILVGFLMRSVGNNLSETTRKEVAEGSERIAQAIDRLNPEIRVEIDRANAENWAAKYDNVEVQADGTLREIEDDPVEEDAQPTTKPKKNKTKKRKARAKKKKKEELPDTKDLIKDLEEELFGKSK